MTRFLWSRFAHSSGFITVILVLQSDVGPIDLGVYPLRLTLRGRCKSLILVDDEDCSDEELPALI